MPWSAADAPGHNKAATGAKGKEWAEVADKARTETGSDASAIRIANAAIARHKRKPVGRGAPKKRT